MKVEVHEVGGAFGTDRRTVCEDGSIEVIEDGQSRGTKSLPTEQAARISELAGKAARSPRKPRKRGAAPPSDSMTVKIDITADDGSKYVLELESGDDELPAWELISELGRASEA